MLLINYITATFQKSLKNTYKLHQKETIENTYLNPNTNYEQLKRVKKEIFNKKLPIPIYINSPANQSIKTPIDPPFFASFFG